MSKEIYDAIRMADYHVNNAEELVDSGQRDGADVEIGMANMYANIARVKATRLDMYFRHKQDS